MTDFFDPEADTEQSEGRLLLGPPRLYVLESLVGQGIPIVSTAATLLDGAWSAHDRTIKLNSNAAFFERGLFFIEHPDTGLLNGFTYEGKTPLDDYLTDVRRIFGTDDYFPDESPLSQWRDITDLVDKAVMDGMLSGVEGTWTLELQGDEFNSLIQAPDMTCVVEKRHRNSTFYDLDDPNDWGPWKNVGQFYFGPVRHKTDATETTQWTVTAYSEDYYLRQIQNAPGVYGVEDVTGTDTVSSEVTDPTQVPNEGDGFTPPTKEALSDNKRRTAWLSAGIPTIDPTPRLIRPVNNQVDPFKNPQWASGLGIRIDQVYPQGYANLDGSLDMGAWIALHNSAPEEVPNEGNVTAGQPLDQEKVGMYDLSGFMFQVQGSILVRLGGPNGLPPGTMIGPGKTVIFCHDLATFNRTWRVPEDVQVYEYRRFDGWYPGQPVGSWVRGAGSYLTMPRSGFYLALRGTYSNDGNWRGFWEDFVAVGNITVPSSFLYKRGEDENLEQNVGGYRAQTVWVTRNPATPWFPGTTPGITVAPNGLSDGTSIRRKTAMGGGVFRDDPDDDEDGSFLAHDSASSLDWEVLQFPIIGQQTPALSVEWVDRDLGEFPAATVEEDLTETAGTITVGTGEALEYEEALFEGETVVASGGLVEFVYEYRDASTFYGVRKTRGSGIVIDGQTLKMRVNVAIDGQKPKWKIANLYALQAIEIERYYSPASAVLVADKRSISNQLDVQPGQASRFPLSGTISAGIGSNAVNGSFVMAYTSRDDSSFFGVSLVAGLDAAMKPGMILNASSIASYPDRYRVLIAREDSSLDPLTNYGKNPEWFQASPLNQGGVNERMFTGTVPLNGHSQRVRRVRVVIEHMSDGSRAALTALRTLRTPRRIILDAQMAQRSRSGPYTHASVIEDVLLAANVEPYRIKVSGGRPIRSERVSAGNVWDTCVQLAAKGGMILIAGPDGIIRGMNDPRLSATSFSSAPKMIFTPDAIGADLRTTPLPRSQVSQVELTGYNELTQDVWTVRYPAVPNPLGSLRRFPSRPALDYNDVVMQAKLLWLQSNGGVDIELSWGQQDNLQLADIVPMRAVVDQAGIDHGQIDLFMTRLRYSLDGDGQTSEGTGRRYRGI